MGAYNVQFPLQLKLPKPIIALMGHQLLGHRRTSICNMFWISPTNPKHSVSQDPKQRSLAMLPRPMPSSRRPLRRAGASDVSVKPVKPALPGRA